MNEKYKKPLTAKELAAQSDAEIDYSDIPELDENFWKDAKVMPPRTKPIVSLRLPQDVIDYFKAESPKGFTSHMAAVLSAYVQAHQSK